MTKGQIESIVMTIIFLAIVVAVVGVALFVLIGAHSQQLARSVAVLQSTAQPLAFASGALDAKSPEGRSILEMGVQSVAASESQTGSDVIKSLLGLASFYNIGGYRITIRSGSQIISKASNINTFCGDLSKKQVAYCNPNPCSLGSIEHTAGNARCDAGQRCCIENYQFLSGGGGFYKDLQKEEFKKYQCGYTSQINEPTVYGICENSACSTGRKPYDGAIDPGSFIYCGEGQECCIPDLSAAKPAAEIADSVSIPIIYRQTPASPEGRIGVIDIQISKAGVIQ